MSALGQEEPARRQYEAVLKSHPDFLSARINLGMLYLNHGNLSAAAEQFQDVLAADRDNALAENNLGIVLMASRATPSPPSTIAVR